MTPPDRMTSNWSPWSQAGDTSAFNELVTRYRHRTYAMIYNMVRTNRTLGILPRMGS